MTPGMTEAQVARLEAIREMKHGIERAQAEKVLARECGVPVAAVRAELGENGGPPKGAPAGRILHFEDLEPWSHRVDGAKHLEAIAAWIRSFVDMPAPAADAVTLWSVATWFVDVLQWAPLLVVSSPEKGCGKTRLLNRLRRIVRRPYRTSGVGATPAVVFRLNEQHRPTFLIDQAEKLRGTDDSRDIVTLLCDGFERGGMVARCGKGADGRQVVEHFDSFGFRTVATVGTLVDTLTDRAIIIRLQRKRAEDEVRRAAGRIIKTEGELFARQTARWADDNSEYVARAEEIAPRPEWLDDRDADLWAPLFAVAAIAGDPWSDRALDAARALSAGQVIEDTSAGAALLRFLQRLFAERDADRLATTTILEAAREDPEAPTGFGGRELASRDVARLLKGFQMPNGLPVRSKKIRIGSVTVQGYLRDELSDAFSRYIGLKNPEQLEQPPYEATEEGSEIRNMGGSVPDTKSGVNPHGTADVPDVPEKSSKSYNAPLFRGSVSPEEDEADFDDELPF